MLGHDWWRRQKKAAMLDFSGFWLVEKGHWRHTKSENGWAVMSKITIATSHLSEKNQFFSQPTLSLQAEACAWTRVVSGVPWEKFRVPIAMYGLVAWCLYLSVTDTPHQTPKNFKIDFFLTSGLLLWWFLTWRLTHFHFRYDVSDPSPPIRSQKNPTWPTFSLPSSPIMT